jgi:DNA-binding protein HU-beta
MRKSEVVDKIAEETGVPKVDVLVTVESFFDVIRDTLTEGEDVHFRGFGSFKVKKKAKKYGRDIKRNVTIEIPPRKVPSFKPSPAFVERVKENLKHEVQEEERRKKEQEKENNNSDKDNE